MGLVLKMSESHFDHVDDPTDMEWGPHVGSTPHMECEENSTVDYTVPRGQV